MFVLGALWGWTDCANQTSTPALISITFGAQEEPFAVFRFLNGISYMIGMVVSLALQNHSLNFQVGIYSVFFALALFAQVCFGCGKEKREVKDYKKNEEY